MFEKRLFLQHDLIRSKKKLCIINKLKVTIEFEEKKMLSEAVY
jgi:hypothetical protein